MKKFKRILSIVLAMTMVLAMGMTALAAPTNTTLKIDSPVEGHTYTAYQLLVGDISGESPNYVLSNVVWGENAAASITYGDKTVAPVEGEKVPEDFLEYLKGLTGNEQAIANAINAMVAGDGFVVSGTDTTVKSGYYVIKDAYTNPEATQITTLSTVMCQVVGPTAVTPKAGTTEHKKKVADINDSTEVALDLTDLKGIDAEKWADSADHDFGDKVPFKLTTTIGSDFAKYTSYYLSVNDTLKDGLKLDQDSIKVYVNGVEATEGTGDGQYSLTKAEKGFKVEFTKLNGNANAAAGRDVVVYYTATLDADTAVIGETGNWNESWAEFSNNPNGDQSGKGTTPKDTAVVFTYKTVVDKVNKDKQKLEGAEFKLTKTLKDGTTKDIAVVKFDKDGTATTTMADGTAQSTGNATQFCFNGLDDGIYTLTETVTPYGYNTIDPVTFRITATHDGDGQITSLDVQNEDGSAFTGNLEFTKNADAGSLTTAVVNKQGAELPSTGGMGTTIFYIVGAMLAVGAAVILVTKKRMNG